MDAKIDSQTTYVCKKSGGEFCKLHTYAKAKNMKKSNTFLLRAKKMRQDVLLGAFISINNVAKLVDVTIKKIVL